MTAANALSHTVACGIPGIGKVPWGSHFSLLYTTRQSLVDGLVAYFQTGILNNERCLWITAEPLAPADAAVELKKSVPGLDGMLKEGRLQIQNFADWHVNGTEFNADKIIAHWLSDEEKALRDGYAGLRVSANAEVMTPAWGDLMAYEKAAHAHFQSRRILALCAYVRDNCQASHVFEVIRTHLFTLCPRDDLWEMLEANLPASRDHLDDFLEPHNSLAPPPQKFK